MTSELGTKDLKNIKIKSPLIVSVCLPRQALGYRAEDIFKGGAWNTNNCPVEELRNNRTKRKNDTARDGESPTARK